MATCKEGASSHGHEEPPYMDEERTPLDNDGDSGSSGVDEEPGGSCDTLDDDHPELEGDDAELAIPVSTNKLPLEFQRPQTTWCKHILWYSTIVTFIVMAAGIVWLLMISPPFNATGRILSKFQRPTDVEVVVNDDVLHQVERVSSAPSPSNLLS